MTWLITGISLWSLIHFVPTLARPLRARLIERFGNNAYRAVFSVIVLIAIALLVIGWRSTPETVLYQLPAWSGPVGFVLMIVAFVLFGASHHPTSIKRLIRHPQLVSVIIWSISHLITNGSTRALVLFGGLGLWALIEIPLINARDGDYRLPAAPGMKAEIKGVAISLVIFAVVLFLHPYFTGVTPIPLARL